MLVFCGNWIFDMRSRSSYKLHSFPHFLHDTEVWENPAGVFWNNWMAAPHPNNLLSQSQSLICHQFLFMDPQCIACGWFGGWRRIEKRDAWGIQMKPQAYCFMKAPACSWHIKVFSHLMLSFVLSPFINWYPPEKLRFKSNSEQ